MLNTNTAKIGFIGYGNMAGGYGSWSHAFRGN